MSNRGLKDIILMNDRDKLTFEYIKKIRPENAIIKAINSIHANKKLYISNIVKQLNLEIPDHIYHISENPRPYLEALKKHIKR